jgi:hypothetical protein
MQRSIVVTFLYELVAVLFFFLNCKPIAGNWDTTLNAQCASLPTIVIFGLVNTSEFRTHIILPKGVTN